MSFEGQNSRGLVAAVLAICVAPIAQAGHYVVSFTGGTHTVVDPNGNFAVQSYYSSGGFDGGTRGAYDGYPYTQYQNASDSQGKLIATYTWQGDNPDEPPPGAVVVEEQVLAEAEGGVGTTTATTGIEGEQSYKYPGSYGSPPRMRAYVTRYSVQHGATFTTSCSPQATTVLNAGYVGASTQVSYSVTVARPKIAVTGGLNGKGAEFLIGQQLTASVQLGSPYGHPFGLTPTASGATPLYQWSVSGADSFKEFHYEANSVARSSIGEKRLLGIAELTAPVLNACFGRTGTEVVVACAPVHFATMTDALPAAGLDVPLDSVSFNVSSPIDVLPVSVHKGQVVLSQADPAHNYPHADLSLFGDNGTVQRFPHGINYRSEITTPKPFRRVPSSQAGSFTDDPGGFVWIQLLQDKTTRTLDSEKVQTEVFGGAPGAPNTFWTFGLDAGFPYEPVATTDHTKRIGDGSERLMYIADGSKDDHDQVLRTPSGDFLYPCEAGDTPNAPLYDTDADATLAGVAHTAVAYHVRQDFTVYQLYKPPGEGSQFVPMQSFHWWWGGDCDHSLKANGTGLNGAQTDGGDVHDDPGLDVLAWVLHKPVHDFDMITTLESVAFPRWDRLIVASTGTYRNP